MVNISAINTTAWFASPALNVYGHELRTNIQGFWPQLERELSRENALKNSLDPKISNSNQSVVMLPVNSSQAGYYQANHSNISIEFLPPVNEIDDDFIYNISRQPGILALAFENQKPLKYIVPGGRFNEFYGWDSYFIARGLLNEGNVLMAAAVADHFTFEIKNYGKILNANRPYYLGRTQPPFLTDLAWKVYNYTNGTMHAEFVEWINAAITEYEKVWTASPRIDLNTSLSKYNAQGRGIPPEVEPGHFDSVLKPIAQRHNLSLENFVSLYNSQNITDSELDTYLKHDRAIRESGLDVTTRFVNVCADLATIDLNSLLYKYETDISDAIRQFPSDFPAQNGTKWAQRASKRKLAVNKYLWNKNGFFSDFNTQTHEIHAPVISATTFYALWSGLASKEQAQQLVSRALPSLEFEGGLCSTSYLESKDHDSRQWDYPAGWAPHQLLAWEGLTKYGYTRTAQRLATKWLNTVCQGALNSNGSVYEKYDVTGVSDPEDVRAEYGNQGSNRTGFGWTNAAFAIGYDHFRFGNLTAQNLASQNLTSQNLTCI